LGGTLIRLFNNHANATAMETNRHKRAKDIILEVDIGSYYTTKKTRGEFEKFRAIVAYGSKGFVTINDFGIA
jgi:hypothetical protein